MNPSLINDAFEDFLNYLIDPDMAIKAVHTDGTKDFRLKTEAVRDQLLEDENVRINSLHRWNESGGPSCRCCR